jgi:hypothetical protein
MIAADAFGPTIFDGIPRVTLVVWGLLFMTVVAVFGSFVGSCFTPERRLGGFVARHLFLSPRRARELRALQAFARIMPGAVVRRSWWWTTATGRGHLWVTLDTDDNLSVRVMHDPEFDGRWSFQSTLGARPVRSGVAPESFTVTTSSGDVKAWVTAATA